MMNTLKDLKEINGTKIMTDDNRPLKEDGTIDWEAFDEMRDEYPICIDHKTDMISFKMMTKPAKEGGKGCQHVDLLAVGKHIIEYFLKKEAEKLEELTEQLKGPFDSEEESEKLREEYNNIRSSYNANKNSILTCAGAIHSQLIRTTDREKRGVEGTNKV